MPIPTRSSPRIRYRADGAPGLWCLLLPPPPSWTSPGSASSSCKPGKRTVGRSVGRRRSSGSRRSERLAGWTVCRKGKSIFTSLLLCVCAQQGRRALRVYPPFQASSSRSLPCANQWQSEKGGEEETEWEATRRPNQSNVSSFTVTHQAAQQRREGWWYSLQVWRNCPKKKSGRKTASFPTSTKLCLTVSGIIWSIIAKVEHWSTETRQCDFLLMCPSAPRYVCWYSYMWWINEIFEKEKKNRYVIMVKHLITKPQYQLRKADTDSEHTTHLCPKW